MEMKDKLLDFSYKNTKNLKKPNKTRVFSNFVWKNPKRTSQKTRVLLAGSFYRANPGKDHKTRIRH